MAEISQADGKPAKVLLHTVDAMQTQETFYVERIKSS